LSDDDSFKDILADLVACRVRIKELEEAIREAQENIPYGIGFASNILRNILKGKVK
jgi:hypothetical protein